MKRNRLPFSLTSLTGKLDAVQGRLLLKVALAALILFFAVQLFYTNQDLAAQNKKMAKYIDNEAAFRRNQKALQKSEALFSRYMVKVDLPTGSDEERANSLEKVKSQYIDQLLQLVKSSNLRVDSYRSEVESKEDFVLFKYNVTLLGDFVEIIGFFNRMGTESPFVLVKEYNMKMHLGKQVRMALRVEVVGVP